MIAWWLSHLLGLDNLSGPFYGFWSGVGSDISEITLIVAVGGWYWHHQCHEEGCWRLGHPVDGKVVCKRHLRGNGGS